MLTTPIPRTRRRRMSSGPVIPRKEKGKRYLSLTISKSVSDRLDRVVRITGQKRHAVALTFLRFGLDAYEVKEELPPLPEEPPDQDG
jgi:hypothetical protein